MKRTLITILAAAMVLSFGGTAFAAATSVSAPAFTDIAGHEAEFELTALRAFNIFEGDAGTTLVRPNDTITRAEVAKVLVTLLGRQSIAQGMSGVRPNFTDEVPTWAWGFVNCAQVMGLVQGYEDRSFKASNNVTYAEMITMLVRAVSGHKEQIAEGFWPYNYLFHAIDHGFTGSVDMGFANLPAPRGDVARLAFATMQVDKLSLATGAYGTPIADSAILTGSGAGQLGFIYTGTVADYNQAAGQLTLMPGAVKNMADKVFMVGATGFEGLMNLSVKAVAGKDGKILAIGRTQAVDSYAGVFKKIDTTVATAHQMVFADGTKLAVPHAAKGDPIAVPARINGELTDIYDLEDGTECVVTRDAAGKVSFVIGRYFYSAYAVSGNVTKSKPAQGATPAEDTKVALRNADGSAYWATPLSIPASARVTINGALANRDDLKAWDILYFAESYVTDYEALEVRATRNVVEGKPTATRTAYPGPKHYATINGVEYESLLGALSTADTYKLALDMNGKLFAQITVTAATPFALVKGYTTYGTGLPVVTVDIRGANVNYSVADNADLRNALIAAASSASPVFGWLSIAPLTNVVDDFAALSFSADEWLIRSVGSDGALTLEKAGAAGTFKFLSAAQASEITIYKADGTYMSASGLTLGGKLKGNTAGAGYGAEMLWIYTAPSS